MTSFSVSTTMTGFPASLGLGLTTTLQLTDADLAHALFVTGRAPGDETRHGLASYWEFVHRVSLIPAYVRRTPTGRLVRSSLAQELDRSEKVNLSYSLGQAFSALFCQRVLGVTRLLHVDRYCQHHNVTFGPGNQRPDLFGMGTSGWVVAEAKGRSNAMESALAAKLQTQKSMVQSINGSDPWVRVGTVSEFPPPTQLLKLRAVDPTETVKQAEAWRVDDDRVARAYYEPFLRLLDAGELTPTDDASDQDADDPLVTVNLVSIGVTVGILRSIVNLVSEAARSSGEGLAERIVSAVAEAEADVRSDGTRFETTWDDALARRDYDK